MRIAPTCGFQAVPFRPNLVSKSGSRLAGPFLRLTLAGSLKHESHKARGLKTKSRDRRQPTANSGIESPSAHVGLVIPNNHLITSCNFQKKKQLPAVWTMPQVAVQQGSAPAPTEVVLLPSPPAASAASSRVLSTRWMWERPCEEHTRTVPTAAFWAVGIW